MRSTLEAVFIAGAGLLVTASLPLAAHHSFAAEFDSAKPVMLQGMVTKLTDESPPSGFIWIPRTIAAPVAHWQCEGGPPNALTRQGWSKDSLKVGDQATIEGFRSKDGTNTCNARSVKLPSGKNVFAGSADDGARRPAQ